MNFRKRHLPVHTMIAATVALALALAGLPGKAQGFATPDTTNVTTQIKFSNTSWKGALSEAGKTGKYIFIDAFTGWCAPCKLLQTSTFKDREAALFFNKNFINLSLDMEKGEGILLAEKWNITAYPTLMILDANGKLLLQQTGYLNGQQLVDFGKQGLAR